MLTSLEMARKDSIQMDLRSLDPYQSVKEKGNWVDERRAGR